MGNRGCVTVGRLGCALAIAFAASCVRVPPVDSSAPRVSPLSGDLLPPAGAFVTVVGTAPDAGDDGSDEDGGRTYLGRACVLLSAERNASLPGYLRALLTCDGEEVLLRAVLLQDITKLAKGRRLPSGLQVIIAEIGPGDVYYDERERFVGIACTTMRLQRSVDRYYQGTLQCFGVPYRFAYVALSANLSPAASGPIAP